MIIKNQEFKVINSKVKREVVFPAAVMAPGRNYFLSLSVEQFGESSLQSQHTGKRCLFTREQQTDQSGTHTQINSQQV